VESVARGLLQSVFPTEKGIRLIGVTVSAFSDDKQIGQNQLSLMI
jgi:DNA polymerase-4